VTLYQRVTGKKVYALCMTHAYEKHHYWKMFAPSNSGVCLKFSLKKLQNWAEKHHGVKIASVAYLRLEDVDPQTIPIDRLPFVKRMGFKDEKECRLIYTCKKDDAVASLPFPIDALAGIVINPHVSNDVSLTIKNVIKKYLSNIKVPISHSKMINSTVWQERMSDAVDSVLT
jgi:hypothetical protein